MIGGGRHKAAIAFRVPRLDVVTTTRAPLLTVLELSADNQAFVWRP